MTYRYSRSNPAADPAHYMYAPFDGVGFLAQYSIDRQSLLQLLPSAGQSAETCDPDTAVPVLPCAIDTAEALRACNPQSRDEAECRAIAEFFLTKIEVARRFRQRYAPNGRPASHTDAALEAYVMAATLFAQYATAERGARKLRWLNALLKTNDVLSFRRDELCGHPSAPLARIAVELEASIISGLASALGVEPAR